MGSDIENSRASESPLDSGDEQIIEYEISSVPETCFAQHSLAHETLDAVEKDVVDDLTLSKTVSSTRSLAANMSLTREVLFMFIICMAQIMTRMFLHSDPFPVA